MAGPADAGTGNLSLTTVGRGHNIVIDNTISGHVATLISAGKANETTAGAIIIDTLNVTAQTGITLTSPSNNITTLGTDTTASGPNNITQ